MAKKIKVSEKTVQELRKGTMAGNLAKAKNASPEMKEALIRFYGVKRVAQAGGIKDSKRAQLGTLPKKSVAMAKPKTTTMGSRTAGKITVNTKAEEKRKADFSKRTNRALTVASAIPVVRGGMAAKAAYSAAAKQVGVAKVKQGVKNKIATKGELSEARSMARGMVKDTAKLKSKTATTKAKTVVKSGASKASGADKIKNANAIRKASKAGK